jgi:hypothetical protein
MQPRFLKDFEDPDFYRDKVALKIHKNLWLHFKKLSTAIGGRAVGILTKVVFKHKKAVQDTTSDCFFIERKVFQN